jgi:hypothetical protein
MSGLSVLGWVENLKPREALRSGVAQRPVVCQKKSRLLGKQASFVGEAKYQLVHMGRPSPHVFIPDRRQDLRTGLPI